MQIQTSATVTYQVQLHETSNRIVMQYHTLGSFCCEVFAYVGIYNNGSDFNLVIDSDPLYTGVYPSQFAIELLPTQVCAHIVSIMLCVCVYISVRVEMFRVVLRFISCEVCVCVCGLLFCVVLRCSLCECVLCVKSCI